MMNQIQIDLEILQKMIDAVNTTSSIKQKIEILKQHDTLRLRELLFNILTSYHTFGITDKHLDKDVTNKVRVDKMKQILDKSKGLDCFLRNYTMRKVSGDNAIMLAQLLIKKYPVYDKLIRNIFGRNLKTGLGIKRYNKELSKCLPVFECATPNNYSDKLFTKFDKAQTIITRKVGGNRCILIFDANRKPRFYSQSGKELHTLGKLQADFEVIAKRYPDITKFVIDGKLCIVDKDGKEDFKSIRKECHKKGHTIESPKFIMFDLIPLNEFASGKGHDTYPIRIQLLSDLYNQYCKELPTLDVIEYFPYTENNMKIMLEKTSKQNWDGIMLREGGYEGKRTNKFLKFKNILEMNS